MQQVAAHSTPQLMAAHARAHAGLLGRICVRVLASDPLVAPLCRVWSRWAHVLHSAPPLHSHVLAWDGQAGKWASGAVASLNCDGSVDVRVGPKDAHLAHAPATATVATTITVYLPLIPLVSPLGRALSSLAARCLHASVNPSQPLLTRHNPA